MRKVIAILKETYQGWSEDNAPRLGAALAYYTVFSLAPLLVVAISVAGILFGKDAVTGRVFDQLQGLFGNSAANAIQQIIVSAYKTDRGIVATVVGVVILLIGASGVFGELHGALNIIWKVPPAASTGIWNTIRARWISFAMVLGIGFLLLVSLLLSAGLAAFQAYFNTGYGGTVYFFEFLNFLVSVSVITLLFALMFKILPDAHTDWREVSIGAAVTALLFTIGKALIGMYIGRSIGSSYGAAGSILVVLLWTYYSAQILFFGAEFTCALRKRKSRREVSA